MIDEKLKSRVHNGKEEIDEYLNAVARGVSSYTLTHVHAHQKGLPVSLEEVPQTVEEIAELGARLVYIDQRKIIDELERLLAHYVSEDYVCTNCEEEEEPSCQCKKVINHLGMTELIKIQREKNDRR